MLVLQTVTHAPVELSAQLAQPAIISLKSIVNVTLHVPLQHIRIHSIVALVPQIVMCAQVGLFAQLVQEDTILIKPIINVIAHVPQEHT